ncbi:RabGAP/TBC [Cristinia sonorae]|uniref:RabGAP/TBC n=1 Tax=Cristinia sonorae TaxID=1940300 RepID=A0A8K0UUK5_9AGAR|nr:RabGAP/TBC [Cristinia sonorae]
MTTQRTRPTVKEIKDAYDHLFRSSLTLSKIKDAALGQRLFPGADESKPGVVGRSLAWKLFLLPSEPLQLAVNAIATPPRNVLVAKRLEYKNLLLERMRAPDGSYEDGVIVPGTDSPPPRNDHSATNLDRNNPLSLHDENPWTEWFASMDLRKTILQDVERTFPDIGYFRDQEVQAQLTNILFVYSSSHSDIGYRQGMHELLACLYYALDYDSLPSNATETDDATLKEFCARSWVAADAWTLFTAVMEGTSRWYEWQEGKSSATEKSPLASHVQLNLAGDNSGLKPYVAPIVQACNRIQSNLLKSVDPELWKRLQSVGIEPQIYGIRWLRLLFTREFSMHDAMLLWDALFACDPSFDLTEWICVAMLIRIRNQLIPSDYSGQLTYLLRYPSSHATKSDNSSDHPCTLLVRQALTLQMSPTPTTGVSIIFENRNLLDIPVEVPQPPPPPVRRRPQVGQRGQSSVPSGDTNSPPRMSAEAGGSRSGGGHARQGSAPMGLPEMIARGLLERGESLGINKTVMNAVSELKRNLPDLASSLARLPGTPDSTYAAYPLIDERPASVSERPPWEPRTRFEVEKDVADMRSLQQRLGKSVAWIVDTLLLDESPGKSEDEKKGIQIRKREALESLAYVRDVLQGNLSLSELDEDRLLSEEELKKRKQAEAVERQQERSKSPSRMPVQERLRYSFAPSQPLAPLHPPKAASSEETGWRGSSGFFPTPPIPASTVPPKPVAQVPRTTSLSSSIPSPAPSVQSILTPNATVNAVPLAPWVRTSSNFSSDSSPFATLPRPPPKTSSVVRPVQHRVVSAGTPVAPQTPPERSSRDQAPRSVQSDPLGALQ